MTSLIRRYPGFTKSGGQERWPSLTAGLLALGGLGMATAQGALLDFEGLGDLALVDGTYAAQGVTFSGAIVLSSGISLNELDFPPVSGVNVVFDEGAPISGAFSSPVSSFSGYFTYAERVTVRGYDAANVEVAAVNSLFTENFVSSGNPPSEWLTVSHPAGIHRFTIEGHPAGTSFAMDDFAFTAVPEASSAAVVGVALGAFAWLRRGRAGRRTA